MASPVRVRVFHAAWSVPSYPAVLSAREIAQVLAERVAVEITDITNDPPVDVAEELGRPLSELRLPLWILDIAPIDDAAPHGDAGDPVGARIVLEGAQPKFEVVNAIERLWAAQLWTDTA